MLQSISIAEYKRLCSLSVEQLDAEINSYGWVDGEEEVAGRNLRIMQAILERKENEGASFKPLTSP